MRPQTRRFGQIDFDSMVPVTGTLLATDEVVIRRATVPGKPPTDNILATVGDISGGGGSTDISDLTGGVDDDMLYRVGGVWTGTGPSAGKLTYDGAVMAFDGGAIEMDGGGGISIGDAGGLSLLDNGDLDIEGGGDIVMIDGGSIDISDDGDITVNDDGSIIISGTGRIGVSNAAGPRMVNVAAAITTPTFIPDSADLDTGIGTNGEDTLSFIAGGVAVLQIKEGAGQQQLLAAFGTETLPAYSFFSDTDTGFFRQAANNIGVSLSSDERWRFNATSFQGRGIAESPILINEVPSATNPTLGPSNLDVDTGIGHSALDELSLIAGGVEATRYAEVSGGIIQTNETQLVTASTTQTQGEEPLISSRNIVTVVANDNDVVTAPSAAIGISFEVVNEGLEILQMFPTVGDNFGLGANIPVFMEPGESRKYIARNNSIWMLIAQAFTPGTNVPNNVVQARRTTNFVLSTAFVDVTLDTTDIETDPNVLEHDAVTDRIVAKFAGTYKITYDVDAEATTTGDSNATVDGRVRLNDAGTGIAGSNAKTGIFEDGSIDGDIVPNHLGQTFYATLDVDDFITLQLEKVEIAGVEVYEATRVLLTAERCR